MEVVGLLEGQGARSVHDILAKLEGSGKKLAYTTVMTILSRLFEKGLLHREKIGRQFLYSHAKKAEKFRKGVWELVYQSLFKNDKLKPILGLLADDDGLSAEELKELKKFVDEKVKSKQRGKGP